MRFGRPAFARRQTDKQERPALHGGVGFDAMVTLGSRPLVAADVSRVRPGCLRRHVRRSRSDARTWGRAIRSPATNPGETWPWCLATGNCAALASGRWRNARPGLLAGRVGCWQPEGWPGQEIGWAFRREFWGRGYATEAAQSGHGRCLFPSARTRRLISLIHPQNERSIAVALRLGMRQETGHRNPGPSGPPL